MINVVNYSSAFVTPDNRIHITCKYRTLGKSHCFTVSDILLLSFSGISLIIDKLNFFNFVLCKLFMLLLEIGETGIVNHPLNFCVVCRPFLSIK